MKETLKTLEHENAEAKRKRKKLGEGIENSAEKDDVGDIEHKWLDPVKKKLQFQIAQLEKTEKKDEKALKLEKAHIIFVVSLDVVNLL